jgi:predicted nucleic acid-binding Zn ribbon protein
MSLKKTALAIGIAIIFAVFIAYGLYVVYEPPKRYEQSDCFEKYDCGKEMRQCYEAQREEASLGPEPVPVDFYDNCSNDLYDNPDYWECIEQRDKCQEEFNKQTERYRHARNSFFVLFVIALGAIITGILLNLESISSGLITGGVLIMLWSLIYTAAYWIQWNKYVKLTALGIVLVILIYLGYKKIEQKTKRK